MIKVKLTPSVKITMDEDTAISLLRILSEFYTNPARRAGMGTADCANVDTLFKTLSELDIDWRPNKGM